jgi:Transglycosylase
MYRYIKLAIIILCALLCTPFILIAGYDVFYLQSKLQTTLQSIDSTSASAQAYSSSFIKLADMQYGWALPANVAIILDADSPPRRNLRNNVKIYITGILLDLHLTHAEQLKIIANKTYLGENCYGFQEAATRLYNKPFQSLNAEETAKLLTLAKSPSYYSAHPKQHLEATERLLTWANLRS